MLQSMGLSQIVGHDLATEQQYMYVYVYIYMCVCVCVIYLSHDCWLNESMSWPHFF